jgi:hypothetical protein
MDEEFTPWMRFGHKTVSIQNPYLSSVRQFETGNLNKTKKIIDFGWGPPLLD